MDDKVPSPQRYGPIMLLINEKLKFNSSEVYGYLFFLGIFSNVVFPSFLVGIYWHPAFVISVLIWLFLFFDISRNSSMRVIKLSWLPFGFAALILLSDLYGKAFLGVRGGGSPLFNGLFLIFTFMPYFLVISRINRFAGGKIFFTLINVFFILFFSISMAQAFGSGFISSSLIKAYSHEPHTSNALAGLRYTLTGPDPNTGSSIASLFIITYFVAFLRFKSYRYLLFFFLSLIPLFFAQGRTVMIGLSVIFFVYFWFFSKIRWGHKFLLFFIMTPAVFGVASVIEVDYLTRGLEELSRGENGSFNIRLQKAVTVYSNFLDSPYLGQGANIEQYGLVEHLDSEYLLLLQRHGIVGLALVLGTIFYLGFQSIAQLRNGWEAHIACLLCGLSLFIMLTNTFVFNVDTFGFLVLIVYFVVKSRVSSNDFNKSFSSVRSTF